MSDFKFYRPLGRTGLIASAIGIGGGNGVSSEDVLHAFDRGVNFFFFSADLHHHMYRRMADAIRALCGRGSARRDRVILAAVTYVRSPEMLHAVLFDQFAELGIDYVDVLLWGWINTADRARLPDLLEETGHNRGPGTPAQRFIEEVFGTSDRLSRMGAVRFVGASFHDVHLASEWMNDPLLDVLMVRHNPAHRGAQARIFAPLVDREARPGIVTFKSQHAEWGALTARPAWLPSDVLAPSASDLYRYSLAQPCVDVCLTGPSCRSQIDETLDAVMSTPPLPIDLRQLAVYGDAWRRHASLQRTLAGGREKSTRGSIR